MLYCNIACKTAVRDVVLRGKQCCVLGCFACEILLYGEAMRRESVLAKLCPLRGCAVRAGHVGIVQQEKRKGREASPTGVTHD